MTTWRWTGNVSFGSGGGIVSGSGSPSGVVSAPVGTLYLRTDGGSGSTLYIKESGSGNTGWTANNGGGGSGTPGGSDTQVQFNSAGSFGGDADITWNYTTHVLQIGPTQGAVNPATVPQVQIAGSSAGINIHTSVAWSLAGIAYVDNPTYIQESTGGNDGLFISRNYNPSADVVLAGPNGIRVAFGTESTNTHDMSQAFLSGIISSMNLQTATTIGSAYGVTAGVTAVITSGTITLPDCVGYYSTMLCGDGLHTATYNITRQIAFNAAAMGFTGVMSGVISSSYGLNVEGPHLGTGTGSITERIAVRISDQVVGNPGGRNPNAWGIFETSSTEKNALGSIYLGGSGGPLLSTGNGTPEGSITAIAGSLYLRTDVNNISQLYVKSTTSGNTGWLANCETYTMAYFSGDNGIPPIPNQKLLRHMVPGTLTKVILPNNLTGSYLSCTSAPTGSYTITIKQNGNSIGTMSFAAGQTTGTFTFIGPVILSPGDVLDFVGQSSADNTLSGIYFTIVGTRS
jgi:hypothetical protein